MKSNLKLVHPLPAEKPKEATEFPTQEVPPPPFHVRHSGLIFLAIAVTGVAVILALDFFGPRATVTPPVPIVTTPNATSPNYVRLAPYGTGETAILEGARPEARALRPPIVAGPNREGIARTWATAVKSGDYRAVVTMLEHGANPNLQVGQGESALARAAFRGDPATTSTLLAHGAAVNGTGPNGMTALMVAASNGHLDVVRLLIAYKAAPDLKDDHGLTALMRAVWNGHLATAEALVAAGAHLDLKDDEGRDLRFFAQQSGEADVMAFVDEKLQAAPSKP